MASRSKTRRSCWGKIVHEGAGNFLNPPTHPEHEWSIRSVHGHTFSMSLSYALHEDSAWLNDECKVAAQALLNGWERPPIDNPAVQSWILQVLGYFKSCYQNTDTGSWNASDLYINHLTNPMNHIDIHAGVHLIRQFYPEFIPNVTHFKHAKWGR